MPRGLLGLQILELMPHIGGLALRRLGGVLGGRRLAPGLLRLTLASLKQHTIALLLGLRHFPPGARFADTRLPDWAWRSARYAR